MQKLPLLLIGIVVSTIIIVAALNSVTKKVRYVYACKSGKQITGCHSYKATIKRDAMDGSYVVSMESTSSATTKITFEPISSDNSYEKGCWLNKKEGSNGIPYSSCKSSQGEWIIIEGPTK